MLRVSNAVGVVGVTGNELWLPDPTAPHRDAATTVVALVAEVLRNLRRVEFGRITEFANDFDDCTLAALGRDARCGEQIDALLLVQRANDDLELRISEDARERRRCRARRATLPAVPKSSASMAFALIAKLPLRLPAVTGFRADWHAAGCDEREVERIHRRAVPGGAAAAEDGLPPATLNCPSSQSKLSSFRLFCVISTNFDFDLDLHRALCPRGCR